MPSFSIPLSGLTASSEALSTTANNLANLNTIGYKDQHIQFSDLFYQTLGSNGAGDPIQQGAGVTVSSKPSDFNEGNVTPTGVSTDVAVSGNGFFVIQQNGTRSYTRAGNFEVGTDKLLETAAGQQVLGYPAVNGAVDTSGGLTTLALGSGTVSPATVTKNVTLTSNLDATSAVGPTSAYATQVNIYDSLGGSHAITFTYTKSATNTWTYNATIPAQDISGASAAVNVASGTLVFNGDGTLQSITPTGGVSSLNNPTITIPPPPASGGTQAAFTDGANQLSFAWNLSNASGTGLLTQEAAADSTASIQQDGASSGTLQKFNINSDGTITGSFSNGTTAILGQIALANFADEQGLSRTGNNDFSPTLASGQPTIGSPTSGGLGSISGGALEQSNVDIGTEFASLIIAQRSYEANARVVTTFDTIAQDTIALKP